MQKEDSIDASYMNRCLQIAGYAAGHTAPNPMVGAVVVHQGKIIGEGYHQRYGQAHAEVNAIASVKQKELLKESTLYVNLEPCSHYGKTPPCCNLIIEKQIPKVVIGMKDPHDKVNGRGIEWMRQAGIEVVVGINEPACQWLNRRFITRVTKQRPYIILKWAQTADGFIDNMRQTASMPPLKISNKITKVLNHQIRTQEAAILVGTNTALLDNPHLTVRKWDGRHPIRMVLDRAGRIPANYNIFDETTTTIIFTEKEQISTSKTTFVKLDFSGHIPEQIAMYLSEMKIESIIVEGGRQLLQSFIDANLWDECLTEIAPSQISHGIPAPILTPKAITVETHWYDNHRIEKKIHPDNSFYTKIIA